MPDPASLSASLSGPLGGALAAAFGGGSIAGYGFAIRTVFKAAKEQIAEIKAELATERVERKKDLLAERAECDKRMEKQEGDHARALDKVELRVRELELTRRVDLARSPGDQANVRQRARSADQMASRNRAPNKDPDTDLITTLDGGDE